MESKTSITVYRKQDRRLTNPHTPHLTIARASAAATEFAAFITCVSRVRWLRDLCSAATVSNDLLTFDIVLRYVGLSQTSRWLGPK